MTKQRKDGAPPCGLWLTVGPDLAMTELLRDLRQVFFVVNNGSAYARNMHALAISVRAEDEDRLNKATALCDFARLNGFASIVQGQADFAKAAGADGVLLENAEEVAAARVLFGADGIVGLHCGTSQEKAAAAHDADADFVVFGTGGAMLPGPDLLRFWTILSDKPAVITGAVTNDYCAYFVEAGAGFIDGSDYIWSHGKGVMQGTSNFLHAIELATVKAEETKQ